MRSVQFYLTSASLFSLMAVSISYPRNVGLSRYQPEGHEYGFQEPGRLPGISTTRYQEHGYQNSAPYQPEPIQHYQGSTTPRWFERQQILQILMPSETPRNDRVVLSSGLKFSNAVGEKKIHVEPSNDRRHLRQKPHSSQESHKRIIASGGTRSKIGDIDRRIGEEITVEEEEVICDEWSSGVSQAHRRSPSQDGDSRTQHVIRSGPTTSPCKTAIQTTPKTPKTTPYYKLPPQNTKPASTQSTLPRPPISKHTNITLNFAVKARGDIIFPDADRSPSFVPKNAACDGKKYCEDVPNYPREHIDKLFQDNANLFSGLFGEDLITDVNVTQRIDMTDEIPLCQFHVTLQKPRAALDKNDISFFIVNDEKRTQGVQVEECVDKNEGPCSQSISVPYGYKTSCKQKYVYRKLVAVDKDGQPTTSDFPFPSCCSCHVKLDPVARMAILKPNPRNMSPAKPSNSK